MRTYLILKDKAQRWNESNEIQAILSEIGSTNGKSMVSKFSQESSDSLLGMQFDRHELASKGLKYERLDQLTMEILFGVS